MLNTWLNTSTTAEYMVVMLIRPWKREIRYCMTIVTLMNVPCLYYNTAGSRSEGDKQGEVPTSTPDANEKKPAEDGMLAIFLE